MTKAKWEQRVVDLEHHTEEMEAEFLRGVDDCYAPFEIHGRTYMPSSIIRHCDKAAFSEMYNDWADTEIREAKRQIEWLEEQ